jgi:hypothetical protein
LLQRQQAEKFVQRSSYLRNLSRQQLHAAAVLWNKRAPFNSVEYEGERQSLEDEQLVFKNESDSLWLYELVFRWIGSHSKWVVLASYCILLFSR